MQTPEKKRPVFFIQNIVGIPIFAPHIEVLSPNVMKKTLTHILLTGLAIVASFSTVVAQETRPDYVTPLKTLPLEAGDFGEVVEYKMPALHVLQFVLPKKANSTINSEKAQAISEDSSAEKYLKSENRTSSNTGLVKSIGLADQSPNFRSAPDDVNRTIRTLWEGINLLSLNAKASINYLLVN